MLEVRLSPYLITNGMSSNKPGNSFLRKTSYVFPVKLLSKTKGPIHLLLDYTCFMWIIMGLRMQVS